MTCLINRSKSYGLTVNEYISSAFTVAAMNLLNREKIPLGIAANIRSELVSEPIDSMGNYTTGISVAINRDPQDNFALDAKRIGQITREQLKNAKHRHLVVHFLNALDKDLIESIPVAAHGSLDHPISVKLAELIKEKETNKGIGISNLGRHTFDEYNNFKLANIQFIGPAFPANLLTVGIITINNRLNVCLRYNKRDIGLDLVNEIYESASKLMIE